MVVIDVFLTYGSFICKVYGAVSSRGCRRKSREIVTRGQECGMHRETRCIMLAGSELGKETPLDPPQAGGHCVHGGLQFIPHIRRIFESGSLCVSFMCEVVGTHMEVRGGCRVSSSITTS